MQWYLLLKCCYYSFISTNCTVELSDGFTNVMSVGQGLKGLKSFLCSYSVKIVTSLRRRCPSNNQEGSSCVCNAAAPLTSRLLLSWAVTWESVLTLALQFGIWLWKKSAILSSHVEKLPLRSEHNLTLVEKK